MLCNVYFPSKTNILSETPIWTLEKKTQINTRYSFHKICRYSVILKTLCCLWTLPNHSPVPSAVSPKITQAYVQDYKGLL